jgi:hypothetical protein
LKVDPSVYDVIRSSVARFEFLEESIHSHRNTNIICSIWADEVKATGDGFKFQSTSAESKEKHIVATFSGLDKAWHGKYSASCEVTKASDGTKLFEYKSLLHALTIVDTNSIKVVDIQAPASNTSVQKLFLKLNRTLFPFETSRLSCFSRLKGDLEQPAATQVASVNPEDKSIVMCEGSTLLKGNEYEIGVVLDPHPKTLK